ncbi:MAG: polysaccharide biosynthesis protein [Clostridia bacterium]|nr:polysaccharide biosynthesis protein [Clostridia bacterium]
MNPNETGKPNRRATSFVMEAGIISISSFLVKVIGVLFKIPLANILGDHMGIFTAAYSLYAMIYMVSTCGLPVAISRMVSASAEKGREREATRILRVSLTVFVIIGAVATAVMVLLAKPFLNATEHPDSVIAAYVIAPSLLFVCVVSAFRGYYQGLRNMYPTAVGQLIEAVLKFGLGLGATLWAANRGLSPAVQAACAICGITAGILLEMIMLFVYRLATRKKRPEGTDSESASVAAITGKVMLIAFPATVTSSALYLSNFLDTVLIKSGLISGGVPERTADNLYSAYTSYPTAVADLLPSTLIYPLAISILPAVSAALAVRNRKGADKFITQSLRVSLLIGLPCCAVLAATAPSCLTVLYRDAFGSYELIDAFSVASNALRILAVGIVFMAVVSTGNALLNAVGKIWLPLVSVSSGVLCLALIEYFGVRTPLGIYAAPLASVACYAVAGLLNWLFLRKHTTADLSVIRIAGKPFLAAAAAFGATFLAHEGLTRLLPAEGRIGAALVLVLCGIVAMAAYVGLLALLKGVSREDVALLPFGKKILKLFPEKGRGKDPEEPSGGSGNGEIPEPEAETAENIGGKGPQA